MMPAIKNSEFDVFPREVYFADDDCPLPMLEEELISHEEFKRIFEQRLFERLGLKITL